MAPGFRPVHPGAIVKDNIDALGVTVEAFAAHIGVSRQTVHAIISGRSSVSAEMAVRLGRAFNTSSRLWLNLQSNHDVWEPERSARLAWIRPCKRTAKRAPSGLAEEAEAQGRSSRLSGTPSEVDKKIN
jgi:addiction module HigA family antidote